jgi:protein TonB
MIWVTGETTQRSVIVALGTLAVIAAIVLVAGGLPRRRDSQPLLIPPSVEVGLVELAPEPAPAPLLLPEPPQPETKAAPEPPPPPPPEPTLPPPIAELLPPQPEPEPTPETTPAPKPKPVVVKASKSAPVRPAPPTETPAPWPTLPSQSTATTEPVAAPAPAPASRTTVPASGGTTGARAIFQPTPEIPPELRRQAMKIVAVVQFTIAADGSAKAELREATPDPRLNRILVVTFGKWRFFPAMERGKSVASTLTLRVPITVE